MKEQSDFAKTGISIIRTEITIKVTKEELTKQLVKEVEGKYITPDEVKENTPGQSTEN